MPGTPSLTQVINASATDVVNVNVDRDVTIVADDDNNSRASISLDRDARVEIVADAFDNENSSILRLTPQSAVIEFEDDGTILPTFVFSPGYNGSQFPSQIKYRADYSLFFTDRSLVDKSYVDAQVLNLSNTVSSAGYLVSEADGNSENEVITTASYDPISKLLTIQEGTRTAYEIDLSSLAIDNVDDADSSITNEKITDVTYDGTHLNITEGDVSTGYPIDLGCSNALSHAGTNVVEVLDASNTRVTGNLEVTGTVTHTAEQGAISMGAFTAN